MLADFSWRRRRARCAARRQAEVGASALATARSGQRTRPGPCGRHPSARLGHACRCRPASTALTGGTDDGARSQRERVPPCLTVPALTPTSSATSRSGMSSRYRRTTMVRSRGVSFASARASASRFATHCDESSRKRAAETSLGSATVCSRQRRRRHESMWQLIRTRRA